MKMHDIIRLACLMICMSIMTALSGQVKIGDNPDNVNPSAVLELEKTNRGLLITRIALTDATDNTTIATPAHSLLIYNTASAGSGGNAVTPGFYYWDNGTSRWKGLLTAAGPAGDVWIDANANIMSNNSANQEMGGSSNIALGDAAFGDPAAPSNYVIAIGPGVCNSETTTGDAYIVAIGLNTAFNNSGKYLNALGVEAAYNNTADNVNAIGPYAAYDNSGTDVNAFGVNAALSNSENHINAFGYNTAANNIGFEVNAFGPESCDNNSGNVVSAMGWQSAQYNMGNDVNAFGVRAAQNNGADGDHVNAFGLEAALNNMGNSVNAFGNIAALNNSGGSVNALGEGAALNNTGSLVNALGGAAGENNTGWSVNMFGNQAGQFNTGAELNAMGAMAAQYNTIAGVNAFGLEAARYNTGYGTNALGYWSAKFNSGDHAVAIGDQALMGDTTVFEGNGNIGIGYHAGIDISTGQRNIWIGYDTQILNPSANDQINIGNSIIRTSDGMVHIKDFIKLTPLASAPSTSEEGTIYYDVNDHKLYVMTDSGWQALWE